MYHKFSSSLNFNSIKVRLEHRAAIAEDAHIEFQFHKGAIRTTKLVNVLGVFVNFNSIKVRLELFFSSLILKLNKFQFHKGAIRTIMPMMTNFMLVISIP